MKAENTLAFVFAMVAAWFVLEAAWVFVSEFVSAVRVARVYYRENPSAEPPDRWAVRLLLRGVR